MRYVCSALVVVMLSGITVAQQHPAHNQPQPATLMSGLGDLHHPVSTSNPEAQKFFDQGLRTTRLRVHLVALLNSIPNWP